jgi:hypothetical protein
MNSPPHLDPAVRLATRLMSHTELTSSQQELLRCLPERFRPERIDRLWLFPPHLAKDRESGFLVLSLLPAADAGDGADYRTLVTVRYEAEQVKGELRWQDRVTEEGSAPPDKIDRVIAGVLIRSGADAAEPIAEVLAGNPGQWFAFLERLGLAA